MPESQLGKPEKGSNEVSWLTTRNDLPTLRYQGRLLHSFYDPVAEAEKMVKPLVEAKPELIVLFGLGLGYHLNALRAKLKNVEILVYEPYEEVYQAALRFSAQEWQRDPRIRVYNDLEGLEDALIHHWIYHPQKRTPNVWIFPPYQRMASAEITSFERLFQTLKLREESNRKTVREKTHLWLRNIGANWPWLVTLPNLSRFHRTFEDRPGVIVAAGPSLSRNGSSLERMKRRAILFAAGSSYGWFRKRMLVPDWVAVLEGDDVSEQLAGTNAGSCFLLGSTTHPGHFEAVPGRRVTFHSERWLAQLLEHEIFVPHGGNVASVAFTAALIMGCNPIILVGQDLSYGDEALHVSGVKNPHEEEVLRKYRRYPMEGKQGVVYGHSGMISYLSWYEEAARYLAKARPDLFLINATEGGARIRGFEEMTLAEARRRFCQESFKIDDVLEDRFGEPKVDRVSLKERLLRIRQDLKLIQVQGTGLAFPATSPVFELCEWLSRGFDGEGLGQGKGGRTEPGSILIHEAQQLIDRLIEKTEELG